MPSVLVLNNYPFEEVWAEVRRGEKPDHHLYGINHFHHRGYEVKLVPFRSSPFWQGWQERLRRFPVPLGSLDQQRWVLDHLDGADLIYAPCQTQTSVLSYLRAAGLIRVPIVCVAHHPLNTGRMAALRAPVIALALAGTDCFPALSEQLARRITAQGGRSSGLRWGPDADFYRADCPLGEGVVAAGRTGRDFRTFGLGASRAGTPARIICLEGTLEEGFADNVQIEVQPRTGYMQYPQLLEVFARARALAIPLADVENLSGLTSLMDALGMGKPVIMTRHPLIDIDIEREGVGIWVEPGDIVGWSDALRYVEEHPQESLQMGRRGRALVEHGLNSRTFAEQIMDIFDRLLGRSAALPVVTNRS